MSKDTGGPAFPFPPFTQPNYEFCRGHDGMTLRDYFAAKALQGMLASETDDSVCNAKIVATRSYAFADAMLAERGK